jgi:hypothetical protein
VSAVELSEAAQTELVTEVSEALATKRCWWIVAEHIAEDATWKPLTEAMRRASIGDRDALGEIEALALAARDAVAERIVQRYLATNPKPPYAPAVLLAKYPSAQIPIAELLHAQQMERAA